MATDLTINLFEGTPMELIVGEGIKAKAGLSFVKEFLKQRDTADLMWVRFNLGQNRDGAVGDCMLPTGDLRYRIAGRFPDSFPLSLRISLTPIYRGDDGRWPLGLTPPDHTVIINENTGRRWIRQYATQELKDQNEAVVWTFGQAACQWLRDTGQADWEVAGRINKIEIDTFAGKMLRMFEKECNVSVY
jgi:hypothetical protein